MSNFKTHFMTHVRGEELAPPPFDSNLIYCIYLKGLFKNPSCHSSLGTIIRRVMMKVRGNKSCQVSRYLVYIERS